jgi:BolA protein
MIANQMHQKLTAAFAPQYLEIIDESHLHEGHSGARPGGETHFRVIMTSSHFDAQSRLERQRAVMDVLQEELDGSVHALALKLSPASS